MLALLTAASSSSFGAVFLVTNTSDDGPGSLRQAIMEANTNLGPDQIEFRIGEGPQTIRPNEPLPVIEDSVVLDATTQPGFSGSPLIELDGSGLAAAEAPDGIVLLAGNCLVRGFVINRFPRIGIFILGEGRNVIEGNFIGTDVVGISDQGNGAYGIYVIAPGNTIGGTNASSRNVISGNEDAGILLHTADAHGNLIQGNWLGIAADNSAPIGNGSAGVGILDAPNNRIGGSAPGAGNVMSGNILAGVAMLCVDGQTNGCLATRGNIIYGNLIGPDALGSASGFGNLGDGIYVDGGPETVIGGNRQTREGNVISGNGGNGVNVVGERSTNTVVQGNTIGLDVLGQNPLGNASSGIRIEAPAALIGGTNSTEGNVVSANGEDGILLAGSVAAGVRVVGNHIGTDIAGEIAFGNSFSGVVVDAAAHCTIGGILPTERNVISGNRFFGVHILNSGALSNVIVGNLIGTDARGQNGLGNGGGGIFFDGAPSSVVGGAVPGAGNLISCNGGPGVILKDVVGTVLFGNQIGTTAEGGHGLGNSQQGINVRGASNDNLIGSRLPGSGNVIAFNGLDGILIEAPIIDPQTIGIRNTVSGNSISSNALAGIRLGRGLPIENDPGDSDLGPNLLQNHPDLSVAYASGGQVIIKGRLTSSPQSTFTIEFFLNRICDDSGFGEGEAYLGFQTIVTDDAGEAPFNATFARSDVSNGYVTATATDPDGNTSAFSNCTLLFVQLLRARLDGDQLELSWESQDPTDWQLESRSAFTAASSWNPVATPPVITGSRAEVTLPLSLSQEFYRLRLRGVASLVSSVTAASEN